MKQVIFALLVLFSLNSFSQESPVIKSTPVIEEGDDAIYNTAGIEVKPEFPGGIEKMNSFLADNYKVPEELKNDSTPKKVFVMFIIEKNGSMTDIKVLRDVGYGTGKEAVRVLKLMPKWSPAQQNGKKVRCLYSMPIIVNGKQ